jgi:hypothetical protein
MFDGNMFLPETGIPIWNKVLMRTLFAVWLPDPLTVATWILKSLVTGWPDGRITGSTGETSNVDIL